MKKVKILGIKIDNVTFLGALKKIESFIQSGKPHQIATVNSEFIMAAQKDSEFKEILNRADLAVPDGTGLIFASGFLYGRKNKLKERVAGIDLVWELAKMAAENEWSIYFLGAAPGVAKKTANRLRSIHRNLKIAGTCQGQPKFSERKVIQDIKKSKADILLVAYSAPKQDKFIHKNLKKLNAKVAMGIGGSFDFVIGAQKRAPRWMQKLGLEWLWRLIREPKRAGRIFTATVKFPWTVFWSKFSKT